MGDRCYMEIETFDRKSAEILNRLVDCKFDLTDGGPWSCEMDEVNYGAFSAREESAAAGAMFKGSHGSGCEYDACMFVAAGGVQREGTQDGSGSFCVRVDVVDGEPRVNANDVEEIRKYLDLLSIYETSAKAHESEQEPRTAAGSLD